MPKYAGAKITLAGDKELQRVFKELPARVRKYGLRRAMDRASVPTVKLAKSTARKRYGLLKRSINKKIKTYSSGVVAVIIGADTSISGNSILQKRLAKGTVFNAGTTFTPLNPSRLLFGLKQVTRNIRGAKQPKIVLRKPIVPIPAKYIHLVELGHGGKSPAPAHPFLKPSLEATAGAATQIAGEVLAEVVEKEAKKLGKV